MCVFIVDYDTISTRIYDLPIDSCFSVRLSAYVPGPDFAGPRRRGVILVVVVIVSTAILILIRSRIRAVDLGGIGRLFVGTDIELCQRLEEYRSRHDTRGVRDQEDALDAGETPRRQTRVIAAIVIIVVLIVLVVEISVNGTEPFRSSCWDNRYPVSYYGCRAAAISRGVDSGWCWCFRCRCRW